jgi:hypothetical protein
VERQAHLAGELGEDVLVGLTEALRVGRPFDHDEPEQLAAMGDRRHADDGPAPVVE